MIKKEKFSNMTHMGVTEADRRIIHMALQSGAELTIDHAGRIYNGKDVWIADGRERICSGKKSCRC